MSPFHLHRAWPAPYVRRNDEGKFTERDDVGRSLGQDIRREARKESKPGEGGPRRQEVINGSRDVAVPGGPAPDRQ